MDLSLLKPLPSPETIQKETDRSVALAYLTNTAWYAIRFLETQVPIPEDVAKNRAIAYEVLNDDA